MVETPAFYRDLTYTTMPEKSHSNSKGRGLVSRTGQFCAAITSLAGVAQCPAAPSTSSTSEDGMILFRRQRARPSWVTGEFADPLANHQLWRSVASKIAPENENAGNQTHSLSG